MSYSVGQVSDFAGVTVRTLQRQLDEEIARLQRLPEVAERAIEVQKTGVPLTPEERFEVFGEVAFDLSYATEAELKWAHSDRQREAMARADAHTKEDWRRLMGEAAAWRAELLAAFDDGEPSCGERAMDLAEEHRLHIARWCQGFADAVNKGTDLPLLSTTTAPLGWLLTEPQRVSPAHRANQRHPARRDRLPPTWPARQPGHGAPRSPPVLRFRDAPTTETGELAHLARLQYGPGAPAWTSGQPTGFRP
ncbi:TipAS antibiotic-recognition domain-containing protein [Streptomyces antibioticus]|uniref:MerR family transcriptional regulator n=1 Tax=Streptomyces antibioticus TaxID=1890 RepID=UPI0033B5A7A2